MYMDAMRGEGLEVSAWPKGIFAITLFVEDLKAGKKFYQEVFGLPVVFEDANNELLLHLTARQRSSTI
jgi:predicted enzyme related to lactoylglutathione lyase